MDGIFHVCRAFEDADVVHVEDRVDPVADLDIIHGYAGSSPSFPISADVLVINQFEIPFQWTHLRVSWKIMHIA